MKTDWLDNFDERQRRLIQNCIGYTIHDPAGLPGHNLMVIIAKMVALLSKDTSADNDENTQNSPHLGTL